MTKLIKRRGSWRTQFCNNDWNNDGQSLLSCAAASSLTACHHFVTVLVWFTKFSSTSDTLQLPSQLHLIVTREPRPSLCRVHNHPFIWESYTLGSVHLSPLVSATPGFLLPCCVQPMLPTQPVPLPPPSLPAILPWTVWGALERTRSWDPKVKGLSQSRTLSTWVRGPALQV